MSSIVVALPKIEDAKKVRTLLERRGFAVGAACSTGARALSSVSQLDSGVLICGTRLPDMNYMDLRDCLPAGFEMLLLTSGRNISQVPPSILSVEMPLRVSDLVNTVDMILAQQERRRRKEKKKPKARSEREQNYISNAKMVLMQRNHLSEEEAYRYIQKNSMDSGTNMVETAQMILMLFFEE